jgi:hypothetical protein
MVSSPENKDVVKALREIAAGKVTAENIEELRIPEEDIFESYQEEEREEIDDSAADDALDSEENDDTGEDEK